MDREKAPDNTVQYDKKENVSFTVIFYFIIRVDTMPVNIEIVIGTYEEFLLGYKVELKNEKSTLVQSFADRSHSGSIRCVAVERHWVASGGTDDRIFIYNMRSRKQSQILLVHKGNVNSLAFTPDCSHLLSAGDDGCMIATRLKTWMNEATWQKAHDGSPVTHVSCHPSGKLALTLGRDLVLRTWNLVKGRVAYKTNLKSHYTLGEQPDCLTWSPTGDYFTITGQCIVEFWSITSADILRTHTTKSKPICITWIADDICLVGLENGKLIWLSIESTEEKEFVAHNARVKAMCTFKDHLVTASSSGEIKLWQIMVKSQNLKEIAITNIGCRPTCIGVLDLEQFGGNYVISSTLKVSGTDAKPATSKVRAPQRGMVTIEYDDEDVEYDDEDVDDEDSDEEEYVEPASDKVADDDKENQADIVAEVENEYVGNESEYDLEDEDADIENERENDMEDEDEDIVKKRENDVEGDESNPEAVIPLPKSRKHKLEIEKRKDDKEKKQRLVSKE